MSGAFTMPHFVTGGAGYKANPTYDEIFRKSDFYRRKSGAGLAQEADRRASAAGIDVDAAQAMNNVNAEGSTSATSRKGSIVNASGGAANAPRKGSVIVASDSDRRDSILGLEATAGVNMDQQRRGSTSLAGDLYRKITHKN